MQRKRKNKRIWSRSGQLNWINRGKYVTTQHMMERGPEKPRFTKFDVFKDCTSPYPVQTVQPVYKVVENFDDALSELKIYGRQIMKPMATVFNEYKNCIMYDRNIEASFT